MNNNLNTINSPRKPKMINPMLNTLNGVRIIPSHMLEKYRPVLELSYKVTLSPHVRDKVNKSLLDTFGKTANVLVSQGCIFAHPEIIKQIKEAAKTK